jgi:hypothetical protein
VFFYVNDIVVLVHLKNKALHQVFERKLMDRYELRVIGQLSWFLGIRVMRNLDQGFTWLLQDAFIDKVATRFKLKDGATSWLTSPLPDSLLELLIGPLDKKLTHEYQQLVGSMAYISVYTRPDMALTHSHLARHLQNAGEKHIYYARYA